MVKLIIPSSFEMTIRIPDKVINFHVKNNSVFFEPEHEALIKVEYWVRYPSYDYIFGIPVKDNPRAKKEVAFFVYRDGKSKKHYGQYYDSKELKNMVDGFKYLQNIL